VDMQTDARMSQQESIAPGQSTRIVTATRRRAMAEERARFTGRRRTPPSALEVAAAQWEKEREVAAIEARKEQEEKLTLSRTAETHPYSWQQMSLPINGRPPDDDVGWTAYEPPPKKKRRRRRMGGMPVMSFATRLIQRERAGGGRAVTDPRARALEQAARRWEEQQAADKPRR